MIEALDVSRSIPSLFCHIPSYLTLVSHLFHPKESDGPRGPDDMYSNDRASAAAPDQLLCGDCGNLSPRVVQSGVCTNLVRNDKGDSKRPRVVTATGTSCLAWAGWRHSAGAGFQAVKRNISIYLPTNYRISFKHYPARTCSLALFSLPH